MIKLNLWFASTIICFNKFEAFVYPRKSLLESRQFFLSEYKTAVNYGKVYYWKLSSCETRSIISMRLKCKLTQGGWMFKMNLNLYIKVILRFFCEVRNNKYVIKMNIHQIKSVLDRIFIVYSEKRVFCYNFFP